MDTMGRAYFRWMANNRRRFGEKDGGGCLEGVMAAVLFDSSPKMKLL
jgi:hypothetical protein